MPSLISLLGKRFGRVVVTARAGRVGRHAGWRVRCDCGAVFVARADSLRESRTKSCGCWKSARLIAVTTTHGGTGTVEHTAWRSMLNRCQGKHNYAAYASRGITVCARWRKFENFLADMGPRPSAKHSIDRVDNDKGYSPTNCRWATAGQQLRNTRRNVNLTWGNRTMCAKDWASERGIVYSTLLRRVRDGWSTARALGVA